MKKLYQNRAIILVLVGIGLIFRVIGFNWGGEGMIFHSDEPGVVEPIIYMVQEHSVIHHNWLYPSMSSSKLIALVLIVIRRFINISWIDYYYTVRLVYALLSCLIILISHRLVKNSEGEKVAFWFVALLVINPIYILYSKMGVGDTPVTLFWLVVALFMQKYIVDKRIIYLMLMSFFAACATMEKWNGAAVTIFIAIGVIYFNLHEIKKLFIHSAIAFLSWIAGLLLLAPNILTEWEAALAGIFDANPYWGRELIQEQFKMYYAYAGLGAVILTLIGLFGFIRRVNNNKGSTEGSNTSRFYLFLIPISLIIDWFFCHETVERHGFIIQWGCTLMIVLGILFLKDYGRVWFGAGIVTAVLIVCAWLAHVVLIESVAIGTRTHDARVVGAAYLEEMGATTANSICDNYTPFLPPYGVNVIEEAYGYSNMINDLIYLDDEGNPCIAVPGKKYAISGKYSYPDWNSGGYSILKEHARLAGEVTSQVNIDLKMTWGGLGAWYCSELDTIRNAAKQCYAVNTSDIIGPSFSVYDISEFKYKARE